MSNLRKSFGSRFIGESLPARMLVFGFVGIMLTLGAAILEFVIGNVFYHKILFTAFTITDTLSFGSGFSIACILMGGYLLYRDWEKEKKLKQGI